MLPHAHTSTVGLLGAHPRPQLIYELSLSSPEAAYSGQDQEDIPVLLLGQGVERGRDRFFIGGCQHIHSLWWLEDTGGALLGAEGRAPGLGSGWR